MFTGPATGPYYPKREPMTDPRSWRFILDRHEDPAAPPATDPAAPPVDPAKPPATGDDKDWKAEAEKWKALSRKNEDQAKANADAAKRLADIEAAQLSDTEKLTAAKDAAEQRAADATARAVRAEVKSLADGFADRDDAVLNLGDLTAYIKDGDVDTAAITAALADVLTRKPHLAKPAAPTGGRPAPDPSQGRGAHNGATDFRKASDDEFRAELAKYGLRPKT